MASDFSFDIVSQFDAQELRNAVDQVRREVSTRYDLKDSHIEIDLTENDINVNTVNEYQMQAVMGILIQKLINRSLSPKILDPQKIEDAGGMRFKQLIKLIKALDQETAKKLSKMIRDNFPKVKPTIQGDSVRVSSKSKDDLQAVMVYIKSLENIKVPLQFTNYR